MQIFSESNDHIQFWIKVIPNASKTSMQSVMPYKDKLVIKVYIQAPAVEGKANNMLVEFLSNKLNLRKNEIRIVSGLKNPIKCIGIPKEKFDKTLFDTITLTSID